MIPLLPLLVSQKETNIWPSIHATIQIKKTNTQIKKWSFCMRIRVSVQRNHLFCKANTQKTVAKVNNLHTEEKPSFVCMCICVLGQRNHSLRLSHWRTLAVSYLNPGPYEYLGYLQLYPNIP